MCIQAVIVEYVAHFNFTVSLSPGIRAQMRFFHPTEVSTYHTSPKAASRGHEQPFHSSRCRTEQIAEDMNPLNQASKAMVAWDDAVPNRLPAPVHGMTAQLYHQLSWSTACTPQPALLRSLSLVGLSTRLAKGQAYFCPCTARCLPHPVVGWPSISPAGPACYGFCWVCTLVSDRCTTALLGSSEEYFWFLPMFTPSKKQQ